MRHEYRSELEDINLVPMTIEDSEKYRIIRNVPDIRKWFGYSGEISIEDQQRWFLDYLERTDTIMCSAYWRGEFVGGNSLYNINTVLKSAEYGRIVVDKKYTGNGFGYKMTLAMLYIAKEQLGLKEVHLEVYSNNIPAIKLYKKSGFKEIGRKKDSMDREMLIMSNML